MKQYESNILNNNNNNNNNNKGEVRTGGEVERGERGVERIFFFYFFLCFFLRYMKIGL